MEVNLADKKTKILDVNRKVVERMKSNPLRGGMDGGSVYKCEVEDEHGKGRPRLRWMHGEAEKHVRLQRMAGK